MPRRSVILSQANRCAIEMTKKRYGVAITWDNVAGKQAVDLDIQALIVDERGVIRDAVYYNNLNAMSGGVMHSGDETTGAADGYDEMIWVTTSKLPEQIRLIIFIVAASGEGSLRDAENGSIHFVEQYLGQTLQSFKIENSMADVDVVGMMEKSSLTGKWSYLQVEAAAEDGNHFMDILEPTIGGLIRSVIPNAPKQQTLCFQMRKGAIFDLPGKSLQRLFFSISVSMSNDQDDIDLDIAAVFMNKDSKTLGCCYFEKTLLWGVTHSGENDCDEDMAVDLRQVPKKVEQIFVVVNLASDKSSVSFHQLVGAVCKVTDHNMKDVASFSLKNEAADAGKGLVICRILRVQKRWELQALGRFCSGSTWKGCVPTIKTIMTEDKQPPSPAKVAENTEATAAAPPASAATAPAASEATAPAEAASEEPLPPRRRRSKRITSGRKNTGLLQVRIDEEPTEQTEALVPRREVRRRTKALDIKLKEVLAKEEEKEEAAISEIFSGDESNATSDAADAGGYLKRDHEFSTYQTQIKAAEKFMSSPEDIKIPKEDTAIAQEPKVSECHCGDSKKVACENACVCQ
eukprot:TRINITY_DN18487_c0_g3_i1.p1 TRINITY_DN18487_c0_g3~~TRINITY_DN18487_c0_g3_i1.p1  ORF type:complete len:574 (+),score=117.70 TRINITY_DN18487_c0_g3_i1:66-1787(+)